MGQFTFKREAKWLLLLGIVPPAIGMLIVMLWPAIGRWLGH